MIQFEGEAEEIVRASGKFSEAYVEFVFLPPNSPRIGLAGDIVRERFRDYVKIAHPELFAVMQRAEKKLERRRLVIVGEKNEAKPAVPTEGA